MSLSKLLKLLPVPFRVTQRPAVRGLQHKASAAEHLAGVHLSVSDEGRQLEAVWGDAEGSAAPPSSYHSVWLRHNCHCPECLTAQNQNAVLSCELDPDVAISEAKVTGTYVDTVFR